MADQPSPRRRFQFRLRTLMIGVTLFALIPCGYIGWQTKIVRARTAWAVEYKRCHWPVVAWGETNSTSFGAEPKLPILRQWLGDRPVAWIHFDWETPPEFIRKTRALLPEAWTIILPGPPGSPPPPDPMPGDESVIEIHSTPPILISSPQASTHL
jgi:hypothetical protein